MKIDLTPEQNDVVRHAVETGRVLDPEQAGREAMALWVERERQRAELLASLDAAEASLARGEGIPMSDDTVKTLASDIMARVRSLIQTDPSTQR